MTDSSTVPYGLSMAQLNSMADQSIPFGISLRMTAAQNFQQQLLVVESAVDWIASQLTLNKRHNNQQNEDQLTSQIVTLLRCMGFNVGHDTDVSGHCDIVVQARDGFLWLAEAKIHEDKGYGWLLKGFRQLSTRYSTGSIGQDTGEIIIYCKRPRIDEVMDKWMKHLNAKHPEVSIFDGLEDSTIRRSIHKHHSTGRDFKIRHKIISLYFNPQE